jgi:hypothetical protein
MGYNIFAHLEALGITLFTFNHHRPLYLPMPQIQSRTLILSLTYSTYMYNILREVKKIDRSSCYQHSLHFVGETNNHHHQIIKEMFSTSESDKCFEEPSYTASGNVN